MGATVLTVCHLIRTDSIQTHDAYTAGEFKDDQMINHAHFLWASNPAGVDHNYTIDFSYKGYNRALQTDTINADYRAGTVNRGKRKGVIYLIKVL